jgi:hypothetical protein
LTGNNSSSSLRDWRGPLSDIVAIVAVLAILAVVDHALLFFEASNS